MRSKAIRSVAIEGLPGAGKTTLVTELSRIIPGIRIVEELAIEKPDEPSLSFHLQNDRKKVSYLPIVSTNDIKPGLAIYRGIRPRQNEAG